MSVFLYGNNVVGTANGKIRGVNSANLSFEVEGTAFLQWYYNPNNPTAAPSASQPNGYLYFKSTTPNSATINYADGTVETHQFYLYSGAYYLAFSSQNGYPANTVIQNFNPQSNHIFNDSYTGIRGVNINISNPSGITEIKSLVVLFQKTLSSELANLSNIQVLNFSYTLYLTEFPYSWILLKKLTSLTLIRISVDLLLQFPASFTGISSLSQLLINGVFDFSDLDASNARKIGLYGGSLTTLAVSASQMNDLPSEWGNLTGLTSFSISSQGWVDVPSNINLMSPTITTLVLGGYSFNSTMTGWGDFSNLVNVFTLTITAITNLSYVIPSWFNSLTKIKTINCYLSFDSQEGSDGWANNMYDFITINASMTPGSTPFRNMIINAYSSSSPNSNPRPSGFYQMPEGYVQGSSNGTPVSPLEKVWVMENQYGHSWTIAPPRITIVKSGNVYYFRSPFNDIYDVVMIMGVNTTTNSSLNISAAKLITKSGNTITDLGFQMSGGSSDDSCPSNINNGYIGGNHGNSGAITITATAHGKTLADVGSSYTDSSSITFYLIEIIDANKLLVISENIGISPTWKYKTNPTGTLTYVSNGANPTNIVIESTLITQVLPSTKNVSLKLVADGVTVSSDGTYSAQKVTFTESYDIIDTVSMVNNLVANRPSGGYITQPDFTDGTVIISLTNIYDIQDKCAVNLSWTWQTKEDLYLGYFGGTQDTFFLPTWVSALNRYFPSSLPVSDGTDSYDFRIPIDIKTTTWSPAMNYTSAYWENGIPPSRVVDMMQSTDINVNFNLGFLPIGVAGDNRSSNVENAWYLYPSKKLYPHAIDDKLNVSGSLPSGTVKTGSNFRGWSEATPERTNLFFVKNGTDTYAFADWHSVTNDLLPMPDYLIGKSVTVVQKTSNVTVASSIVNGFLAVSVTSATPLYGYCILKFS